MLEMATVVNPGNFSELGQINSIEQLVEPCHQLNQQRNRLIPPLEDYVAFGTIRLYKSKVVEFVPNNIWMMRGRNGNDSTFQSASFSDMVERGWIRTNLVEPPGHPDESYLQIFAIPEEIGRRTCHGPLVNYRRFLKYALDFIDVTASSWNGECAARVTLETYVNPPTDGESLFFIFNTLKSPDPAVENVKDIYSQQALKDILENSVQDLKSDLYPYQKRAAAMMIQRETYPKRSPDPRTPQFRGPTGHTFYLDSEEGVLRKEPHLYEESRGGIAAETMGYGKTLICLAVVLATRGHFPAIPSELLESPPKPFQKTPTLFQLAARKAGQAAIPWKAQFQALAKAGENYERCIEELNKNFKEYDEPLFTSSAPNRTGKRLTSKPVKLSNATLVIVPPNLLVQWRYEISKHVEPGGLDMLVIDHSTKSIPGASELIKYDLVLITKARFEAEYRDDDLNNGKIRRGEPAFQSPLTDIRWLRVICDEGHAFAGSGSRSNAMVMLNKMYIERKWVVSGTPSNTLVGVEVGLAANESSSENSSSSIGAALTLQSRRKPEALDREAKDLEKLRLIVVHFLKVQPWANSHDDDYANFRKYLMYNSHSQRRRPGGLRTLLQSLMVRHRIEDIEIDLKLPPLYNRVALLEPSFYDRLSINLFISALATNFVTSERADEDYMFHPKNRKMLDLLIFNLRQSCFHWVGFKPTDLVGVMRHGKSYLNKHNDTISELDRALLLDSIAASETALEDSGWQAFSKLHEIGVFLDCFPEDAAEAWALDGKTSTPLLLGSTQARDAQKYIAEHIADPEPAEGLVGAGLRAMQAARKRAAKEDETAAKSRPESKIIEEPKIKDKTATPAIKPKRQARNVDKHWSKKELSISSLIPDSTLYQTRTVGFSSAKLTYLMNRVLELQRSEKIIIFYETNNIAFWTADALELLSVKFLIYSNTLTNARRATYLETFNHNEDFRVLLMDLKQAAHGLHIACASRVFIVNPIWQPNIESQAIKRAHRIGQTRPVYVETLVLRDTLEDRMLRRRKEMSNLELQRAEKTLLDDGIMSQIIKDERVLSFKPLEATPAGRVARLERPQPLFRRETRTQGHENPEDGLIMAAGDVPFVQAKRRLAFSRLGTPKPEAEPALKRQKQVVVAEVARNDKTNGSFPCISQSDSGSISTTKTGDHLGGPSTATTDEAAGPKSGRMSVSFVVNE